MKKIEQRFVVLIFEMAAFCAIMLFGIFCGPQHPQIFFWGGMIVLGSIIAIEVAPSFKDTCRLVFGMIVLAIAGTIIDKIVSYFFGNGTILGDLIECILLAPFYFPLASHFLNMCKTMVRRLKEEDAKQKSKQ